MYHHGETGAKILDDFVIGPAPKDDEVVLDSEIDSNEQQQQQEEVSTPSPLIPNPRSPQWPNRDTAPASMFDAQTGNAPDHSTSVRHGKNIFSLLKQS